ncbi:hypothetical protein [Phytoactinopolyspora halotolerans]|uniref:Aminoglycoside phosphotransferase domain-containing protein n=1 Tax=Phytoactinopolyspora halotolerans TaxID=1981512 RepID=A0A6L9S5P3_9ACTN|nr:hypothetical protein [Phytoactinopolyspora halotolerans]NEE00409.1 hypothetical protein [Phytoactinopolyspora halotolerans]
MRSAFGLVLAEVKVVSGGVDARADTFRGVAADGSRYAVKWSSGGSAAGLVAQDRLFRVAAEAVPRVVRTRSGDLWAERLGARLSVVTWIDGRPGLDGPMTRERSRRPAMSSRRGSGTGTAGMRSTATGWSTSAVFGPLKTSPTPPSASSTLTEARPLDAPGR